MLRPKAERKNIELVYDNKHLFVRADRNRIRQVLIILIDNAIAYSDAGAVRCRLRRHLEKVRIEVVYNGRGMDEDHRSEEHTSELQSRGHLVCRLLLEKKNMQ